LPSTAVILKDEAHPVSGAQFDEEGAFSRRHVSAVGMNFYVGHVSCHGHDYKEAPFPVSTANKDELIGRIHRTKTANRQRLAFVNSELSGIAVLLKKASSQMECLLANERCELHSVLSQLNIDRILQLLSERDRLTRDIQSANEELKRLGVPL
jgi:hypothetical protein